MASETVSFTCMKDITQKDWDLIVREHEAHYPRHLADDVLDMLKRLKGPKLGFQVDRYEHSLQSATRALRDGADEELVVVALLHDIGDLIAPENHCDVAAGVLKPYISEQNHWLLKHHVYFTGYYFFQFVGMDRAMHKQFVGHPAYAATKHFVEAYDGPSFDPKYDTLPLETFEPMVRRVFARPPHSQWRETRGAA
ncbi:MAG: phosphohydrolase [Alphaproteobacteria bacterium]|nr:phosphohydrolase [Alphaproteobacteria bacterium]